MTVAARVGARLAAVAGTTLLLVLAGCVTVAPPRNVTIWVVSGEDDLTFDTAPSPENDVYSASRGQVQLQAALNETVDLQIGLRSTAPPAGPFDVRVTDFVGPAGKLPAADVVSIFRVHYTRVERFRSWYPGHTGRPARPHLCPDILVPWDAPRGGRPLVLAEPRNEIVWLDVYVPATASPGSYHARLELRSPKHPLPAFACDVQLEVLPVALPGRRSLPVLCRVDPRDLLTTHLRWPRTTPEETRILPDVASHGAALRLVNATMRLLEAHRTNPVLWACFPKFRPTGERTVEVQWDEYDELVAGWLDGSAFADRLRLDAWPLPASIDYPDAARNGGVSSPAYARLLVAYLEACQQHFAERGWLGRGFVRLAPPEPLSLACVETARLLGDIGRQGELAVPSVAHLPARSLRGLGWHEAPSIELPDVRTWAAPAMWFEPAAMERERKAGRQTWFLPDAPPYSGSLAVEAPASDAQILPWQAYRYGATGVWIEQAAEFGPAALPASAARPWAGVTLIHPGEPYGLHDQPVAALRLKRLRRGLLDFELLRLLEDNGKRLLAQKLAEQIVRWAFTDACQDSLVAGKESGWPRSPAILRTARTLMLQELAGEFEPNPAARQRQIESLSQWGLMMNQPERVTATIGGVRLALTAEGMRARVLGSVSNATNRPVQGRWSLAQPPPGWQPAGPVVSHVDAGARRPITFDLTLTGLAYNVDGVYPFELELDTPILGPLRVPARLAVAVCSFRATPALIDGQLNDWPLAANNTASDFRLCRPLAGAADLRADIPTLPTRAFFTLDRDNLYIGVRCTLPAGENPTWQMDNALAIDGAVPWGQDVVEVLLEPRGLPAGTSSDLYCLQVKPSGLVIARKGCLTEPPIGASVPWSSGARVAVRIEQDAWVVELALPLAALDGDARRNRVWGLNVTRLDARRSEYSSWSGARGHCYSPQSLGNLLVLWPQPEP